MQSSFNKACLRSFSEGSTEGLVARVLQLTFSTSELYGKQGECKFDPYTVYVV